MVRKFLQKRLFSRGYYMEKFQDLASVQALIAEMQPVTSNHGLIRVGGDGDGGYLLPDDLDGLKACYSPGVGPVSDFETDMANRGMACYLADWSVDGPAVENDRFHFEKKFLGNVDDHIYMRLDDWVARNTPDCEDDELILQMDIEGSEYPVLLDCSDLTLRKFRIIQIELHGLNRMFSQTGFELIAATMRRLLRDYAIVHIHPNNCTKMASYGGLDIPPVMEFTLLRRTRITHMEPTRSFPHPLDETTAEMRPPFDLPTCWYNSKP